MNIRVAQTAECKEGGWWHWSVWLEGSSEDLDRIKFVEYFLHETFPEPVQRRTDRTDHFRLRASGWGEFKIHIQVHLLDGNTEKLEHWLRLREEPAKIARRDSTEQPEPQEPIDVFLSCALVDLPLAMNLTAVLKGRWVRVRTIDDLDPDVPPEMALSREAGRLKGAIFLISEVRSPHLIAVAETLAESNVPLIPVLVGPRAKVPKVLSGSGSLCAGDASDVDVIAEAILERLGFPQR